MYNEGGSRGGRGSEKKNFAPRTGAARRTYPLDGPGPRVGRIARDVPRAERVDGGFAEKPYPEDRGKRGASGGHFEEKRRSGGYAGRPLPEDPGFAERDPKKRNMRPRPDNRTPKPAYAGPRPPRPEVQSVPSTAAEPFGGAELPMEAENLLVGRNPIREALRAGRPVEKLLVASGDLSGAARDIIKLAKDAGVIVQMVDQSRLDQIYPAHQGLLAYVAAVPYSTVDEMLDDAAQKGEEPFLILLDGITDPHNLGAIIRTAECVGAHGVILPERRAAGLSPAAAKAAAGALNHMKIARVTNLNREIDDLKAKGIWIVGTAMDGQNAFTADLTGPMALVIGSEGDGISKLTLERCDIRVTLPMKGHIESLNASVAAGVMMYEIARARSL